MSNKANYEVTFQYDFDEDNPSKFGDGRIKRVMAAHEGQFVSVFDDYGLKDMSFNINTTLETLKTIMETVLKDAERSGIRMTIFAKKKFDLVLFNVSGIANKEEFIEKVNTKQEEFSFKKIHVSQYDTNELSLELNYGTNPQDALKLAKPFLESLQAKDVVLDINTVDAMQMDNYKNRKKNVFDN